MTTLRPEQRIETNKFYSNFVLTNRRNGLDNTYTTRSIATGCETFYRVFIRTYLIKNMLILPIPNDTYNEEHVNLNICLI